MSCTYCGAPNAPDEHRCHRCGRRLSVAMHAAPRSTSPLPKPALGVPNPSAPPESAPAPSSLPRQRPPSPGPIIRFEELVAGRSAPSPGVAVPRPPAPAAVSAAPPAKRSPRRRRTSPDQPWLPLGDPPAPVEQALTPSRPEPSRYCERPVAGLVHRTLATVLDLAIVTIAFALVLVPFHVYGGRLLLDSALTRLVLGGAAAALLLFYRLLGVFWEQDSPGMVWTGLRLVNFDGFRPTRKQRAYRLAGALLSLAAAGFGFVWAIADQEKLTWHDHISKTFPSPRV